MQSRSEVLQMCFQLHVQNNPLPSLEHAGNLDPRALLWGVKCLDSNSSSDQVELLLFK